MTNINTFIEPMDRHKSTDVKGGSLTKVNGTIVSGVHTYRNSSTKKKSRPVTFASE